MYKSSESHPLDIASIAVPHGRGLIGISMCPGSCDDGLSNGPWRRDLDQDITALRAWGATHLVTLIEDAEFDRLHVRNLGERAEQAGLNWYHLPIPDMGTPDWQFERRWLYAGLRLRRALQQGERIMLHCRAGLGRAGMLAARLLAELGTPAEAAIAQVRAARRRAIQTQAQADWAAAGTAIPSTQDARLSTRLACLLGGALGDAFGYPVQSDRLDTIRATYGPAGLQQPAAHLTVSANTQMTLFTLEGLTRAWHTGERSDAGYLRHLRLAYLDWLECQGGPSGDSPASRLMKHASLHVARSPDTLSLTALKAGGRGSLETPLNASPGYGALVRAAPAGLMPGIDPLHAFTLGQRGAALTHGHANAHLPAGAAAACVALLLSGQPLPAAARQARTWLAAQPTPVDTLLAVDNALRAAQHPYLNQLPGELSANGSGTEVLAIALYAAVRSLDFPAAMRIAVNQDGDSAAAACVAGQFFGAQYGLDPLPHAWIRRLDTLDALCDLADWAQPMWLSDSPH